MSTSFDLGTPDHFTVGTIGPKGQRVFYLQCRQGRALVTLKVEKEQMAALAEHLAKLLGRLPPVGDTGGEDLSLLEPVTPAWAVGSIGVGYDEAADRVLLVLEELREEDAPGDGATARLRVTRAQAARFVGHARALVRAGRPTCRACGRPVEPTGHLCGRRNGHQAH